MHLLFISPFISTQSQKEDNKKYTCRVQCQGKNSLNDSTRQWKKTFSLNHRVDDDNTGVEPIYKWSTRAKKRRYSEDKFKQKVCILSSKLEGTLFAIPTWSYKTKIICTFSSVCLTLREWKYSRFFSWANQEAITLPFLHVNRPYAIICILQTQVSSWQRKRNVPSI